MSKTAYACTRKFLQHVLFLRNVSLSLWLQNRIVKWLDDVATGVQVPVGSRFLLLHVIHTGSGAHPTSYPMGNSGSFPKAWSWPITTN
jgi:hypothetical protein